VASFAALSAAREDAAEVAAAVVAFEIATAGVVAEGVVLAAASSVIVAISAVPVL
jgi:hypothetical protein